MAGDRVAAPNDCFRDDSSLPQPRVEEGTRRGTHLERIAVALERIAEAVAPQARPKERPKEREERDLEVTDIDRAAADQAARKVGLVFSRGRK